MLDGPDQAGAGVPAQVNAEYCDVRCTPLDVVRRRIAIDAEGQDMHVVLGVENVVERVPNFSGTIHDQHSHESMISLVRTGVYRCADRCLAPSPLPWLRRSARTACGSSHTATIAARAGAVG